MCPSMISVLEDKLEVFDFLKVSVIVLFLEVACTVAHWLQSGAQSKFSHAPCGKNVIHLMILLQEAVLQIEARACSGSTIREANHVVIVPLYT